MFFTKLSLASLAALAAVGQARHEFGLLHPKRSLSSSVEVSSVTVYPVPLSTSVPLSTGGSGSESGAASATGSSASDLTLTYTLGTGTSTSVVTTTIHHTSTDVTYVTAVCSFPHNIIGKVKQKILTRLILDSWWQQRRWWRGSNIHSSPYFDLDCLHRACWIFFHRRFISQQRGMQRQRLYCYCH